MNLRASISQNFSNDFANESIISPEKSKSDNLTSNIKKNEVIRELLSNEEVS